MSLLGLDTSMHGFHMLTAITQEVVNEQFKTLYDGTPELHQLHYFDREDPKDPLEVMKIDSVGPPTVQFAKDGQVSTTVWLTINLSKGWFKNFGRRGRPRTFTIDNWNFSFPVSIETRNFEGTHEYVENMKRRLSDLGYGKAGDYRIEQLLFNFLNSDLSNFDKALISTSGLPDEPSVQADFIDLMKEYRLALHKANEATKKEHSIIGTYPVFKATGTDEADKLPTLVPTDVDYRVYPYQTGIEIPGLNLFLYLEMTGHKAPPGIFKRSSDWIVPGSLSHPTPYGCVALSREAFMEGWLLPKLNPINIGTLYKIPGMGSPADENLKYEGFYYDKSAKQCKWVCNYSQHHDKKMDLVGSLMGTKVTDTTEITNYVQIAVPSENGTCTIKLTGESRIKRFVFVGLSIINTIGTITWSTEFTLKMKPDGTIDISGGKVTSTKPTSSGTGFDLIDPKRGIEKFYDIESMNELVGTIKVDDVVSNLDSVLNGSYPFFTGQGKEYVLKYPSFNQEGDLLCELDVKQKRVAST